MKFKALVLIILMYLPFSGAAQRAAKAAIELDKLEHGVVKNGQRVGLWKFYDSRGDLELAFDYDSSRIRFARPDTSSYLLFADGQWRPRRFSRPPRPLGSADHRMRCLARALRYPASGIRQLRQGKVVVAYTVGAEGHTRDYIVEESPGSDFTAEVLRALESVPDDWIPALYQGKRVDSRFYVIVEFYIGRPAENSGSTSQHRPPYIDVAVATALY